MKNAVRNILSSVFILLAGCLLLITCANPMSGVDAIGNGGGIITVTIGGNARKTVSWANTLDSENLTHEITVSGGQGGPHKRTIPPGGGTASFSVIPGEWTITVEGKLKSGEVVAFGRERRQINMGDNGTIPITMERPDGYPSFTVTFNANGGSPDSTETVYKYSEATRPRPPTKAGMGFFDWYREPACINKYDFNTAVTGDVTLYAGWSSDFCVVTFVDDSGATSPELQNIARGGKAGDPGVSRTGYTGLWYKEPTFNTLWDFDNDAVTDKMSLYIEWTANGYHVVFEPNGGGGLMENQSFVYGTAQNLTANAYTRTNHSFDGWATSESGPKIYDDGQSVINLTAIADATVKLYALWKANNLVNAQPPDITGQPAAINEIYLGDTVELTVTASPPTSGGALTYQWYKKANAQDNGGTSLGTENGADTATYNTPTSLAVATYYYYCVVTNTDTSVNGNHTVSATSDTVKVIVYGVGSGTKQEPFIVHDESTLRKVGTETETGGWTLSAHYKQIKNITLPDPDPGQSNWTPIGKYPTEEPADGTEEGSVFDPEREGWYKLNVDGSFTGSYDGNGKTISNLKINAPSADYMHPQGLFGCIADSKAVVENVGIVDCDIKGGENVGGVVGDNFNGMVQYCYVTGKVSGSGCGGLVGYNGGGTVRYCYAICDISGTVPSSPVAYGFGGVVGYNDGGTVQNCYSTGDVSGIEYVGGVVGSTQFGMVQNCYSTSNVSGIEYVGGVVGVNYTDYGITVKNCYATGTVSGGGCGGVVGWGSLINCVALNPNIISDSTEVGRVLWRASTSGTSYNASIIYGRIDMKKNGDTWIGGGDGGGNNGTDITSDDWGNPSWWTGTAKFNETETAWDFTGINGTNLPTLRGMPGGTEAQNPVIK